jgi:hypothetical protein
MGVGYLLLESGPLRPLEQCACPNGLARVYIERSGPHLLRAAIRRALCVALRRLSGVLARLKAQRFLRGRLARAAVTG